MDIYAVVKIDMNNYPCVEHQDISVELFGTYEQAYAWMKEDFEETCEHETEEIHDHHAFKNDDEHEVIWVIK